MTIFTSLNPETARRRTTARVIIRQARGVDASALIRRSGDTMRRLHYITLHYIINGYLRWPKYKTSTPAGAQHGKSSKKIGYIIMSR